MGDAAGIGPEIILKALNHIGNIENIILIGNKDIFDKNENICKIKLPKNIEFLNIEYQTNKITPRIENKYSGELAYLCLKKACNLAREGIVKKIATAPLSKNALHLASYNFSGQTEILQEELGEKNTKAQMLFIASNLKILLLTRHEALINIPKLITPSLIEQTSNILNQALITNFNISSPKIAMCALNPHCGENGILGDEEIKIIAPTIKKLQQENINIYGPYSADTLLANAIVNYQKPPFDAYISCYHDQALPAIKSLGLDNVLNITIGLKALRSSPSHGTAYDIAYKNRANYQSMLNAIRFLI